MASRDLINKLDAFIRKYYRNQMIRGGLISLCLLSTGVLIVAFAEFFARFDILGRTILFYSYLAVVLYSIAFLVASPLLKLFRLGKVISYEDASQIIGDHFPQIKDKLLNTLQLQDQIDSSPNADLIIASVEKRTEELRPVGFTAAIDLSKNLKFLKYASAPLLLLLVTLLWKPETISQPAERILQHRTAFEAPAPFRFVLETPDLSVAAGKNFTVRIRIEGASIPSTVYMNSSVGKFRMQRAESNVFEYTFSSVNTNQQFFCSANGWNSPTYKLIAHAVPGVVEFTVESAPPRYTGQEKLSQENYGELLIPEGSNIKWSCTVKKGNDLQIRVGDSLINVEKTVNNTFIGQFKAKQSFAYWFVPSNKELGAVDSIGYTISVIKDARPTIKVIEVEDSLSRKIRYFTGNVSDDYGFSSLRLAYRIKGVVEYTPLLCPSGKKDNFYATWNMDGLEINPGDFVEYWFEIFDNDGINGPKKTKSSAKVFSAPTSEELEEERNEADKNIKSSLEDAIDQAEELKREIDSFKERLRDEKALDWRDKKDLESLLEKQKELSETLDELNRENEKKNSRLNEFSEQEERILEKQQELSKLMNEVMSDELRELYDKMQELLEEMDPEQLQKQLDQMDVGQDALEKELDRALEQFKQLEWEIKMEETISKLEELAEKQRDLASETENKEKSTEELKKQQDQINKEFEDVQKDLQELKKENQELKNPNSMMDSSDEEQEVKEAQEQSSENLEKGKEKKASEMQKKAADAMEKMSQQMQQMQQQQEKENLEEDMDALRALLENIVTLSFEEEALMKVLNTTDTQDPRYVDLGQIQRKLKDDSKIVEDSLFALSMRVRQIASAVNREIGLVNHHMDKAVGGFTNRETANITTNQQYVMTSFNNLALLLDEALKQMQNKQECNNPGSGNCNKPGGQGKKPSASDMKKMQETLGKKLENLKAKMGEGANKGEGKKPGGQMSKELAQMAAQQAALREMAKERAKELNQDGSGDGDEMKKIAEEMEQLERDILNKNVDDSTLERQRDILSRLLEAEEAERTRGEKKERKSTTGNQGLHPTPPQTIEYLKDRANELDMLKTVPADLAPYYKDRVNDYFNTVSPND